MSRCRWISAAEVPGGRFHLPGCMGSAVYGPDGCTCPPAERARKDLEQEVGELKARVAKLERALKAMRQ